MYLGFMIIYLFLTIYVEALYLSHLVVNFYKYVIRYNSQVPFIV